MELGVTDPVPAFNAPAVSHQLQQRFWGGAQAGDEQMGRLERSAVSGASLARSVQVVLRPWLIS